jgi:PAS domain S-box-containing protein
VNVGELFVSLAESRAHPTALLEVRDELILVWANSVAIARLGSGHGPLRPCLRPPEYARWEEVCRAVLAGQRAHEMDADGRVWRVSPLDERYVAIESRGPDARFDMLFSHHVDGVFFMTLDEPIDWQRGDPEVLLDYAFTNLRITALNEAMCQQYGATREQLIGTTPQQRWAHDRAAWREHMRQLYNQGHVHHTLAAPTREGVIRYVEGAYACIYDALGRITGHCGTQRDVTEERRTASALNKSQERLELALASAEIGVWDYDPEKRRINYDREWFMRLGYDPDTTPYNETAWWASKMHPNDYPEFLRSFHEHVHGRAPFHRVEYRVRAANGEWLWFHTSGKITARASDGRPLRFLGTTIDVTERKLLQQRLAASERMASIGTLAAGVGHEINNPLTYIMLNLELLDREVQSGAPRPERMRTMIEQTRYGTERVRSVVRDLQSLTRAPEDRTSRIDPTAIVERCLEIAHHQIKHRATILRDLRPIPTVLGNEGRMVQLFLNLLINAAQAIPEGDADHNHIRVATSTAPDGRALIEVTDTGSGIPADVVSRIFDPFFTTKAVGEGTGLGLAICRTIVLSMNGDIEVDADSEGPGTTFRVRLPAAPPSTDLPTRSRPPTPTRRTRVLVIDDEPQVGALLVRVLPEHHITSEVSARTALLRLRRGERFDHILCDLMMPDLTGMDFYDALAYIDPAIQPRVIFISAGAFTDRAREFLQTVQNRRLDKPFDVAELTAVLSS